MMFVYKLKLLRLFFFSIMQIRWFWKLILYNKNQNGVGKTCGESHYLHTVQWHRAISKGSDSFLFQMLCIHCLKYSDVLLEKGFASYIIHLPTKIWPQKL